MQPLRLRWPYALAATLVAVVLLVHGPVLAYPYVQEDWEILGATAQLPASTAVAQAFGAVRAIHYRPLVATYLILLNRVAGLDGRLSHALVLLMLAAASLAIALVVERLTGDARLAAAVAVAHAAANAIHLDALMIQTCGVENMGGTFCFFFAAWLFLERRDRVSALFYAVGLLVKETTVVLPALLVWCALVDGAEPSPWARARALVPRLWPHALVLAAYLSVKTRGLSPFTAAPNDPYFMSLFGWHLWDNLVAYLRWTLDAILPTVPLRYAAPLAVIVTAAALVRRPRWVLFFAGWFVLGIGPMLVLPNHTYRYYLEFALPAALALWWSALLALADRLAGARRGAVVAGLLALALCVTAARDFRERARNLVELDGSNATLRRATTVARVRALLESDCAQLPRNATLLFDDVESWAFGQKRGARLWCPSVGFVFDTRNLQRAPDGTLAIVDAAQHQGELATGAHNYRALDAAKTFVVRKRAEQLILEPVTSYVQSPHDH